MLTILAPQLKQLTQLLFCCATHGYLVRKRRACRLQAPSSSSASAKLVVCKRRACCLQAPSSLSASAELVIRKRGARRPQAPSESAPKIRLDTFVFHVLHSNAFVTSPFTPSDDDGDGSSRPARQAKLMVCLPPPAWEDASKGRNRIESISLVVITGCVLTAAPVYLIFGPKNGGGYGATSPPPHRHL